MEGPKSQFKLTRTQSSLLRSSHTIRSSIQSLSSVSEISPDQEIEDVEEQKPHKKPCSPPVRPGFRSRLGVLAWVLSTLLVSAFAVFAFLNRDGVLSSENLLLFLILVAILLFFVSKNKTMIRRKFNFCKHLCNGFGRSVGITWFSPKTQAASVQWFIGEPHVGETVVKSARNGGGKKIVGQGVEFYINGDFYEGEFYNGKSNGSGVYNYFVNGRFEGDWIDGKYDGYGVESWAKGSRYRGQYRLGLRHGYGVYKFYTGDAYAGEWCSGQSNGVGEQICVDGSCYVGEFKRGLKHGLGRYHFRNGDRYAGEYFGDKIHGFGIYQFANGHSYEGSWHEGRKQGLGMYTFRNREMKCGEWDSGILKIPLFPSTKAVLLVVQAARKTAENAIGLRCVDEQVSKAVMAANRAAAAARVAAVKAVQNRMDGNFYKN